MAQDLFSRYKKMFDDALSSKLSQVGNYFNPTSNGGNNFWSSGVAKGLADIQVTNPLAPLSQAGRDYQINVGKTLENVGNNIGGGLGAVAKTVGGTGKRLLSSIDQGVNKAYTGAGNIYQGVQQIPSNPVRGVMKAGQGALQIGTGIGQAAAQTNPWVIGSKAVASVPYADKLNINIGGTQYNIPDVAANMVEFAKNPAWKSIFGQTSKLLDAKVLNPTTWKTANFLISNTFKGGSEGAIQALADMPDNLSPKDQAVYFSKNILSGVGSELLMNSISSTRLINALKDDAKRLVKENSELVPQWVPNPDGSGNFVRTLVPKWKTMLLTESGTPKIGLQARQINPDEQAKVREIINSRDKQRAFEQQAFEYSQKVDPGWHMSDSFTTNGSKAYNQKLAELIGDPNVPQNANMRRFSERVSESPNVPPQVQEKVKASPESYYKPISNKETMAKVSKMIADDEAGALNLARTGNSTEANATSVALLEKYLKEGKYDQFDELVNTVSPRFTSQGQAIQVLSVFDKLTPTGAVRYAKKIADEAGIPLPEEKIKTIVDKANKLSETPSGTREKIVNTSDLVEEIKSVVPPTIGQKINTIQTMSQLLNPVTAIRNTLGNMIFSGAENVSDVVGTGLDKLVSVVTGKRTKVLPSISAQAAGAKRGLTEGVQDAIKGVNTQAGVSTQFELPATMTFKKGLLNKLEKAMNIELRATDRAAYQAAFDGSLNNQMRAAGVQNATEDMLKVAHADALYRTFQDNSKLAQFFGGAKQMLNKFGIDEGKFGLGDLIIKYPKTPANILSRGIEYSPAGFVKGIYGAVRPLLSGAEFNQKQFVEDISRATVGTGLVTIGAILAKNGIITGRSEKDKDIAATDRAIGSGAFKFNVDALKRFFLSGFQKQSDQQGDTVVSYDWAQPTAIPFTMGANYILGGKAGDQVTSFLNSADAAIEGLTQQPLVKGLAQFATDFNQQGVGTALANAVAGAPASFVPTALSKVASTIDRKARETYAPDVKTQAINQVINKIPVLRSSLPQKYDTYGREVNYGSENPIKRIVQNFLSPSIITKIDIPEGAKEVIKIFENTGETSQAPNLAPKKVKINGQDVKLTGEQMSQFQKYIGEKSNSLLSKLSQNQSFQKMTDEDKAKLMASYLSDISSAAKIEVLGNKPQTVSANVKSILSGKLSTQFNVSTKSGTVRVTRLKNPRKIRVRVPKKIKVKVPKVGKVKIKKLKKIKV